MPEIVYWRTARIQTSIDSYKKKPHCLVETVNIMVKHGRKMVEDKLDG